MKKSPEMTFYNDPQSVDQYIKMCDGYDPADITNFLKRHLRETATVLELGSGPGFDLEILKNDYRITGSDLSDEFIKRGREKFPGIEFLKLDAVAIETDQQFDCIFSNKVLHHLTTDVLEHSLARQQRVLNPKGIFAHTFWIGGKEFTQNGMYFNFHERAALLELVDRYFNVIDTLDYAEFEEGDSIFIIAKNDMVSSKTEAGKI